MPPTNTSAYSIGDTVRLSFIVQSTAGTTGTTVGYTDSDSTLVINDPSGNATVVVSTKPTSTGLTRSSTGQYRYDLVVDEAGRWSYTFRSTGTVVSSTGGAFGVRPRYASS